MAEKEIAVVKRTGTAEELQRAYEEGGEVMGILVGIDCLSGREDEGPYRLIVNGQHVGPEIETLQAAEAVQVWYLGCLEQQMEAIAEAYRQLEPEHSRVNDPNVGVFRREGVAGDACSPGNECCRLGCPECQA